MSEQVVKRYDPINSDGTCGMCIEDADYGAYVEYADYAALEAELAKLKGEYEWVASINTALDESNQSAWGELARLRAGQEPVACHVCHGQGEVWTGENQSFGYMSMQPPEPIMEACPECSGELVRPASAGDDRKLSDIGNELHNLSCHVVHHNEGWANQLGTLASELWYWPSNAGVVDERAAFEAWAKSQQMPLKRDGVVVSYAYRATDIAWNSWQARAVLSAPSHGEQVPVAYVDDHYLDQLRHGRGFSIGVTPAKHRREGENNGLYTHPCADVERLMGELVTAKELLEEAITTLYCENSEGGDVLDRVNAFLLAAAPSAGSQKEQGE